MRWWRNIKRLKIACYNMRLHSFSLRNNTKAKIYNHFREQANKYWSILFTGVSVTLSIFVPTLFADFDNKDVLGFYTSIGGMTGGMLAIIFTFITLLANYALTEYPPEFFKISGNDRKQAVIYVLLAILSVAFFAIGLSYPSDPRNNYWLNVITIFLLMIVFLLVFVSYTTMRARLNPQSAFRNYIVQPALKLIDEAEKKAKKVTKLFASNPTSKDKDLELHAKQQAQILLTAHYNQLNSYIGIMYDYHAMLRERKKERAAINVLVGIQSILFRYIDARKDNLILLPTDYLMVLQTDSQKFFESNFERINSKLSEYIDDNNLEGIRNTVTLYTNLGIKLSELVFPSMPREDPQLEQCFGYLNQVRDMAIQKNNSEATFEIAKAYGTLGALAISKDYSYGQNYAYDSLQKLYLYAVVSNQDSVAKQVVWSIGKMSDALFNQEDIDLRYNDFTDFIRRYTDFMKIYLIAQNNTYDLSPNNSQDVLKPIQHLSNRFRLLVKRGSTTTNPDRIHDQHDSLEVFDRIREIARKLADHETTQVVDRYFYLELMRILQSCILKLIDLRDRMHWRRSQHEIDSKLNWAVNQFGFGLRKVNDKVDNSNIDELAELLTIIGLYSILKDNDEIANIAMTLIGALAETYMQTGANDRDWKAPRIMMNVFILASAALQKNKNELLKHSKLCVNGFKKSYIKVLHSEKFNLPKGARYLGTYPDQFNYEMARFVHRNDYEGDVPLPDTPTWFGIEKPQNYAERVFDLSDDIYTAIRSYLK